MVTEVIWEKERERRKFHKCAKGWYLHITENLLSFSSMWKKQDNETYLFRSPFGYTAIISTEKHENWHKANHKNQTQKQNTKTTEEIGFWILVIVIITSISRKFQGFWLEYVMKGLLTVTSVTMILLTFWLPQIIKKKWKKKKKTLGQRTRVAHSFRVSCLLLYFSRVFSCRFLLAMYKASKVVYQCQEQSLEFQL